MRIAASLFDDVSGAFKTSIQGCFFASDADFGILFFFLAGSAFLFFSVFLFSGKDAGSSGQKTGPWLLPAMKGRRKEGRGIPCAQTTVKAACWQVGKPDRKSDACKAGTRSFVLNLRGFGNRITALC